MQPMYPADLMGLFFISNIIAEAYLIFFFKVLFLKYQHKTILTGKIKDLL